MEAFRIYRTIRDGNKENSKMRIYRTLLLLAIILPSMVCLDASYAELPSQDDIRVMVQRIESASSDNEYYNAVSDILDVGVGVIPSLQTINSPVTDDISTHFSQLLSCSITDSTPSILYFADHKSSRMLAESLVLSVSNCGGIANTQYCILKTLKEMEGPELKPAIEGVIDYLTLPVFNPIADIGSESATVRRNMKHLANELLEKAIPSSFQDIKGEEGIVGRRDPLEREIQHNIARGRAFVDQQSAPE